MSQFKGAIQTDKELKHTLAKPIARALDQKQIAAMKGAALKVLDISNGPEPKDYLVYVRTKEDHEFIWDIDGRDVIHFVPLPQRSPLEEMLVTMAHMQEFLKRNPL
jgi:hypothetical protein